MTEAEKLRRAEQDLEQARARLHTLRLRVQAQEAGVRLAKAHLHRLKTGAPRGAELFEESDHEL